MKKINRRNFLKQLTASTCGTAAFGVLPSFGMTSSVLAQSAAPIEHLLVIKLDGGADTLAMFQPDFGTLADVRPTIFASEEDTLPLIGSTEKPNPGNIRFHKDFTTLQALYNINWASVINKVGYNSFTRSHEHATAVYERGVSGKNVPVDTGWINRLAIANSFRSLDVFDFPSGSIATRRGAYEPTLVNLLSNYRLQDDNNDSLDSEFIRGTAFKIIESYRNQRGADSAVKSSWRGIEEPISIIQQAAALETLAANPFPDTRIGRSLRESWRVFSSIGAKISHVSIGGYDTHGGDKPGQSQNNVLGSTVEDGVVTSSGRIRELDQALLAYVVHMIQSGLFEKSLIMIVTEFSRTIRENDTQGTDHGLASSIVMIGPKVKSGIFNHYAASDFVGTNFLQQQTNLVSIYRSVVASMGYNPDDIFDAQPDFSILA